MTDMADAAPDDQVESLRQASSRLKELAAEHGLYRLRVAAGGNIVADIAPDRDLIDVYDFEIAVAAELGLEVHVVSAGALGNEGIDERLVHATAL